MIRLKSGLRWTLRLFCPRHRPLRLIAKGIGEEENRMMKLILADNKAIFRAGIAKVLAVEDEMRIVAQAQTAEQMFMALDKFKAAVLIVAGGFIADFNSVVAATTAAQTGLISLADTGAAAAKY